MEDTEEVDYVAPEHDRLVSSLTKLDKTQHIKEPTRNEPTNLNSEFSLIKKSNKININNVVKVLEDTAHNVQVGKKLKKSQETTKVLPKPLEKPQAERVKRATGYEAAKKKVGRWDPVIARNRTVDFVSFPIKHVSTKLQPTKDYLSKLVLKSPLEKELDAIDPPPEPDHEEEEETVYPMSYEEMVEQRQHLAKIRARQSYTAAKAKRQSKIKSKKFHRVLKKEKLKQQLKEFEELQHKDPEEALKKLESLEKVRALERHTLRHKNTGKWAKSKLVRAKYDKEVRQQLAEQLAVSRSLTHKTKDNNESSDEEEGDVDESADLNLSQDPTNPWMMKHSGKSNINAEFDFGYKKYLQDKKMFKRKEKSDSESDDLQETNDTNDLDSLKIGINKLQKVNESAVDDDEEESSKKLKKIKTVTKSKQKTFKKQSTKLVATSNWTIETIDEAPMSVDSTEAADIDTAFESYEVQVADKVQRKLHQMRQELKSMEKLSKKPDTKKAVKEKPDRNSLEYYSFKNKKMKQVIDEELIETNSKEQLVSNPTEGISAAILKHIEAKEEPSTDTNIDPTRFIEVKPKYLNTSVVDSNQLDELDDDDEQVVPKVNIEEVFEEDDVVASFRQEKQDEIDKNKPQDIDLSLPGWGSWGGKGVKPIKRKRNRFIVKAAPKVPRRDDNKGDVIIKEFKNPKLTLHKVNDVPFPFSSVKDYEASIRAPIGNTFIPETAHKKLIKPSVITKAGAIIEPMDEDELLVKKNRTFKNQAIIKLLAKK